MTFNASVSDVLDWKFTPQQREVRVLPGETALAFYTATNRSKEDIIGVATYSVTPAQVAPYFSKIQCFCFEEQRLNAGETVDMPVFFYLDPDLLMDVNMKGIETVTLSYTFFSKCLLSLVTVTRGWIATDNPAQRRGMTIRGKSRTSRQHHDRFTGGSFSVHQKVRDSQRSGVSALLLFSEAHALGHRCPC